MWVDAYSLKKIVDDCQPVLFVTPNPISVQGGQLGQAAISWNTYRSSEDRVTLAVDGGPEEPFAEGRLGLKMFGGIRRQARYQFRLYVGPETTAATTIEVSAVERTSTIVADPNPVASGPALGRTRISWATPAGVDAEVYVSRDGGPEYLFAQRPFGSTEVNWIAAGSHYEFRLYTKNGGTRRLLAKVVVTR